MLASAALFFARPAGFSSLLLVADALHLSRLTRTIKVHLRLARVRRCHCEIGKLAACAQRASERASDSYADKCARSSELASARAFARTHFGRKLQVAKLTCIRASAERSLSLSLSRSLCESCREFTWQLSQCVCVFAVDQMDELSCARIRSSRHNRRRRRCCSNCCADDLLQSSRSCCRASRRRRRRRSSRLQQRLPSSWQLSQRAPKQTTGATGGSITHSRLHLIELSRPLCRLTMRPTEVDWPVGEPFRLGEPVDRANDWPPNERVASLPSKHCPTTSSNLYTAIHVLARSTPAASVLSIMGAAECERQHYWQLST